MLNYRTGMFFFFFLFNFFLYIAFADAAVAPIDFPLAPVYAVQKVSMPM